MTVIKNEVRQAVQKEQAEAERVHGLHHSYAEKYAVMLEELEEAEEELQECRRFLAMMWKGVRADRDDWTAGHASRVADAAERAACECVQLAAVAHKVVGTDPAQITPADDGMPQAEVSE